MLNTMPVIINFLNLDGRTGRVVQLVSVNVKGTYLARFTINVFNASLNLEKINL